MNHKQEILRQFLRIREVRPVPNQLFAVHWTALNVNRPSFDVCVEQQRNICCPRRQSVRCSKRSGILGKQVVPSSVERERPRSIHNDRSSTRTNQDIVRLHLIHQISDPQGFFMMIPSFFSIEGPLNAADFNKSPFLDQIDAERQNRRNRVHILFFRIDVLSHERFPDGFERSRRTQPLVRSALDPEPERQAFHEVAHASPCLS